MTERKVTMQTWKLPDKIKILEALGAVADGRVVIDKNNQNATCKSSDGSKKYTIKYDIKHNAITSDDNSAHWQGRLGYPAIAVLMLLGELPQDNNVAEAITGIPWKEINEKFSNDYQKTLMVVNEIAKGKGVKEKELSDYMEEIMRLLGEKAFSKI